jgi:sec-independent protein translocase protein TatA
MSSPVAVPLALAGLGPTEIILILLVLVLLFGAKKLPELARGSGRALRIFKAETKGLIDDDEDVDKYKTDEQRQIEAHNRAEAARRLDTESEQQPETGSDTGR